jgi:hypothetical protein
MVLTVLLFEYLFRVPPWGVCWRWSSFPIVFCFFFDVWRISFQLLTEEWLTYLRDATEWQIENPHIWASPGVASKIYDYIQRSIW